MAARVLLQRRAVAPLTAALLAGGTALYPKVAYAEAPEDNHVSQITMPHVTSADIEALTSDEQSKKPIYDDCEAQPPSTTTGSILPPSSTPTSEPEPTTRPRGPTPTDRLASQIRRARLLLYRQACAAEDGVNSVMDRAFHLEKSFTDTVASLAPARESGEKLMPGLIYVLVAAMAGSIMTRRSNILLRSTVPVALGVGAGWAVIPITMRNCGDLAWKYEQRFPALADAHLRTRDGIKKGISFAKVHTQVGKQYADEKVSAVRGSVEDWVKKGK